MAFPELSRRVTIQLERHRQWRFVPGQYGTVPGSRSGDLGDASHSNGVMVAASKESLPRRRTESRSVEAVVSQSAGGKLLKVRGRTRPAEGAGRREANIIEQNEQYVWCAFWWAQLLDRWKFRVWVFRVIRCEASVRMGWYGKDGARMGIGFLAV